MTGIPIHDWLLWYLAAGLLTSVAAFSAADLFGGSDPPRGAVRAALAGVAGALWPLLAVGLLQLTVVRAVAERGRPAPAPVRPPAAGVRAGGQR